MRPAKILHHTQRFALEKTHDPSSLYGLCKEHERIAHHSLIENEESAPPLWKIKKEPDSFAPKFGIDELVAKYRVRWKNRSSVSNSGSRTRVSGFG